MNLDDEDLARALGLVRIGVGGLLFLAPRLSARLWTGERLNSVVGTLAVRGMGARDVVVGTGLLTALENKGAVRGWLEASAACDAADALGTVAAWRRIPAWRALGLLALEVGATALALRLASDLD